MCNLEVDNVIHVQTIILGWLRQRPVHYTFTWEQEASVRQQRYARLAQQAGHDPAFSLSTHLLHSGLQAHPALFSDTPSNLHTASFPLTRSAHCTMAGTGPITTPFCELLNIKHPICLAGMNVRLSQLFAV